MTKRQGAGDGPESEKERVGDYVTIYRRGLRWHASFQHEGKQHRKGLKTTNKKEARRRAIRLEADLMEGRYTETVRAPGIKIVTDAYVAHMRAERKAARTLAKVELVVGRLLDLAERRKAQNILDVNLSFVDAYRAERAAAGAKQKTVLNESVILRQVVNFALSREFIKHDPLKNLRLKKVKPRTQPCWTRAQVDLILATAEPPHLAALTVLAETGMRVGEVKHLTWEDVDFERKILQVREKEGWRPKTGDQRAVPINAALMSLLRSLPRHSRWMLTAARSDQYPNADNQISERRLLEYLKRVLKRLGLPGHLHTFRHAFISHALTLGTPESIVRQWVGHVDAQIMQLYTHINDAASQDAMAKLTAKTIEAQREQAARKTAADGDATEAG